MKNGFTTGSCAAAASKAAAWMLLSGLIKKDIKIDTPAGIEYSPEIEDIHVQEGCVRCAVRKESGDDPDITDGILVYSTVSFIRETDEKRIVRIEGGEGVGKVTRPGLDQPVGSAAINSVPRRMIEKEVREVMDIFDHEGSLLVKISIPMGVELAKKTFNPRLGIEGGLSVIGTTGIIEPMSIKAFLDTVEVELRQKKEMGATVAVISPGNYGLDFMKEKYSYDPDRAVKSSNYIGDTIDIAAVLGYKKLLLCGHVGKLIKLSGGIMNTHSKEADCRMELIAAAAARSGADTAVLNAMLDCATTEEALDIADKEGILEKCFEHIMERIYYYLNARGSGRINVQCMVYSNKYGLLGATELAAEYLNEAKGAEHG